MAFSIIAAPGDPTANSYLTLEEAAAYFETRAPLSAWDASGSQEALLVMATRMMDAVLSGTKTMFVNESGDSYYRIGPKWTGAPVDGVQALAWPREGMLNRNGFAIANTVIPQDLKNATAELAGQLAVADRSLDNKLAVLGVTSASAGSVSVAFKNSGIQVTKFLPDVVLSLLVPSWYTEETMEFIFKGGAFDFEVIP